MARKKTYNPEKRAWRGRSYNSGKGKGSPAKARRVVDLRDASAVKADKKIDVKGLIDAFDGMMDVFFPKKAPSLDPASGGTGSKEEVELLERDRKLAALSFRVASFWRRQRIDSRVTNGMEPFFMRLLNEIERETRGDDRSCECLAFKDSGGTRHDIQCPARRS